MVLRCIAHGNGTLDNRRHLSCCRGFGNADADASKIGFDDSLIYREIAQPLAQRKIPMIQMMREEALAAFRAWENKPNKIEY